MACITFVTLGATKTEKLSALTSDPKEIEMRDQKLFDHADNSTSLVASSLKRPPDMNYSGASLAAGASLTFTVSGGNLTNRNPKKAGGRRAHRQKIGTHARHMEHMTRSAASDCLRSAEGGGGSGVCDMTEGTLAVTPPQDSIKHKCCLSRYTRSTSCKRAVLVSAQPPSLFITQCFIVEPLPVDTECEAGTQVTAPVSSHEGSSPTKHYT